MNALQSHTLDRYLTACEALDVSLISACFNESAVVVDPLGDYRGRTNIHAYFEKIYAELAELSFETGTTHWRGAACAIAWKGNAKQKDGTRLSYAGIDVFTFGEDGLIAELSAFWAPDSLLDPTISDD